MSIFRHAGEADAEGEPEERPRTIDSAAISCFGLRQQFAIDGVGDRLRRSSMLESRVQSHLQ